MLNLPLPDTTVGVIGAGNLIHGGIARQKTLVGMPLVAGAVLEPARQAALVLPVNRHPVEVNRLVIRQWRATAVGVTHRPDTPGAVLESKGAAPVHLQLPAVVANPALPAAELVQAGRVHDQVALVAQGLTALLDTAGVGGEQQVALYAGVIGGDHHPVTPHGFENLQREGSHLGFRGLQGRPPRTVKGVLMTLYRQTQAAIHDTQVGIATQGHTEVEAAVPGMAVVPEPVIGEAVTGRRVKQRLGGLVNRVVVEFG